jgi:hypothetical protein
MLEIFLFLVVVFVVAKIFIDWKLRRELRREE